MIKTISLRTYLLLAVLFLGVSISIVLSTQSAKYFLTGSDLINTDLMLQAAKILPASEKKITTQFGYHVASSWQDVPLDVKITFHKAPNEPFKIYREVVNWNYISPPEKVYMLMKVIDEEHNVRFVSLVKNHENFDAVIAKTNSFSVDPMLSILLWGLGSTLLSGIMVIWIMRSITNPVEKLNLWAQTLGKDSNNQSIPDFKYSELNTLAGIVHHSVTSVQESVKREQQFLQYASHELRTPITILRNNADLLTKIFPTTNIKEQNIRDRISRASLSMKNITETLLWLSRDNNDLIPTQQVSLEDTVTKIISELDYLLKSKQIKLTIETAPSTLELAAQPFHMLISNMIRNAFQHTQSGEVTIIQTADKIYIANTLATNSSTATSGFGLGLKLSQKLVERFGWKMLSKTQNNQNQVTIEFSNSP